MLARVSFESTRTGSDILIPQDFLVTRLDGNGVFVVGDDDTARWRPVTLGAIIGTQTEVTSGLTAGDRVVYIGQRALSEGDRLMVTRTGMCCDNGRITYHKPAMRSSSAQPTAALPASADDKQTANSASEPQP